MQLVHLTTILLAYTAAAFETKRAKINSPCYKHGTYLCSEDWQNIVVCHNRRSQLSAKCNVTGRRFTGNCLQNRGDPVPWCHVP